MDDGAAAGRRVVADLLEVGNGAVGVVDGHQIAVCVGILRDGQCVLQVARCLGGKACRAWGVGICPMHGAAAECHTVDLVRFGIDGTDVVAAGGYICGNGEQCGLAAGIGIHDAHAVAGIGIFRVVALAEVEADLIQLGKLAAVPSQVKFAAVHRAVDRCDLRHLRNIVEDHIAACGGGHGPLLAILHVFCRRKGVGGLLCGRVIGEVGVGSLIFRCVLILRCVEELQSVVIAALAAPNFDGCRFGLGVCHIRCIEGDLHDGVAAGMDAEVELMLVLVAAGFQRCGGCHQRQAAVVGQVGRHNLGIGAHAGVERLIALRVVVDGQVVIAKQVGEGGIALAALAEIHAALAPVVGDAEGDEQHIQRAPDLFGADAQVNTRQRHAAHDGDGAWYIQFGASKHLKKDILVVRTEKHDVAAAIDDAVKEIHYDVSPQVNAGVPLKTEAHLLNGLQALDLLDADVLSL